MKLDPRRYLVATKAIVLREDGLMLALRRSETAPTHPLEWDLPGGILDWGEEADSGIARETMEEAGIEVEAPRVFHVISRTNPLDEFWTTIYYVARARTDTVTLSYEHDTYQWVTIEEFLALQGASRNNEAVARYVALHKAGRV